MLNPFDDMELKQKYTATIDDKEKIINCSFTEDYELNDDQISRITLYIKGYMFEVEKENLEREWKTQQTKALQEGGNLLSQVKQWIDSSCDSGLLDSAQLCSLVDHINHYDNSIKKAANTLPAIVKGKTEVLDLLHIAVSRIITCLRVPKFTHPQNKESSPFRNKSTFASGLRDLFHELGIFMDTRTFQNILAQTNCPELQPKRKLTTKITSQIKI